MADATIEKDPPIEVARCDVEDRGVRWPRAEASLGLGKSARPHDLHVARDQATHQPTHEIGTVNKKQSCHRSARERMQGAYHGNTERRSAGLETLASIPCEGKSHPEKRAGGKSRRQVAITLRPGIS